MVLILDLQLGLMWLKMTINCRNGSKLSSPMKMAKNWLRPSSSNILQFMTRITGNNCSRPIMIMPCSQSQQQGISIIRERKCKKLKN